MSFFVIDVEADNTSPASGSMVCFGAVKVDDNLDQTFYGETAPILSTWNPDALAVSGFSREEHENFSEPDKTMKEFNEWVLNVNKNGRPIFISDNIAFDWMWICYYFDLSLIENPFGWSGRRIGDIYSGLNNDMYAKWKHLRTTKHTHNPVDDAMGNAEAILKIKEMYNLNIKLK